MSGKGSLFWIYLSRKCSYLEFSAENIVTDLLFVLIPLFDGSSGFGLGKFLEFRLFGLFFLLNSIVNFGINDLLEHLG